MSFSNVDQLPSKGLAETVILVMVDELDYRTERVGFGEKVLETATTVDVIVALHHFHMFYLVSGPAKTRTYSITLENLKKKSVSIVSM